MTITSPADGDDVIADHITVSGTASADTDAISVNGKALDHSDFTHWQLDGVPLVEGLNIISVHAGNAAMRETLATVRVNFHKSVPSIIVTSPTGAPQTGAATYDVSGTWANLDPQTIRVEGPGTADQGPGIITVDSDTSGRFMIPDVPLIAGTNLLTIRASDSLGRQTSATATVTRTDGYPAIAITHRPTIRMPGRRPARSW